MTDLGFKLSHLCHWICRLYNHLNLHISRAVSNKHVTKGETIPKWLLLKFKVIQLTRNRLYSVRWNLLPKSVVYGIRALPGPYASLYAYVRTAYRPIRSQNSLCISNCIQYRGVVRPWFGLLIELALSVSKNWGKNWGLSTSQYRPSSQ